MSLIIRIVVLSWLLIQLSACAGQSIESSREQASKISPNDVIGGPFENAEYMYIDMPEEINSIDTSPGWNEPGSKLMITGTIYELDGRTPAPDVVLYYYQTDVNGIYANAPGLNPAIRRHGYIRGWIKTDKDGRYTIYTTRPGAYPGGAEPAHIHLNVKEPSISKEYYIHDLNFDDDPAINTAFRKNLENRGGSGILRLLKKEDLYVAEHNIILGLNIPNYPKQSQRGSISGRAIGEDIISFTPEHVWGPDKGKKVCPICKYGRHQGILYFVGKNDSWVNIKEWMSFFEKESVNRGKYLKVYFVFDRSGYPARENLVRQLEELGQALTIEETAITIVPSFSDQQSEIYLNKVNPDISNTIILFQQSTIVDKFLALENSQSNFEMIKNRLSETQSEYHNLVPIHLVNEEK